MRRGEIERRVDPAFYSSPEYGALLVKIYNTTHTVAELVEFIDSGRPITGRLRENGIPAYEVGHIEQGSFKKTQIRVVPNTDRMLGRHDILTGRVGGLGCFAKYQSDALASFSDNVLCIRPKSSQKSRAAFIAAFLNSSIGNIQLLRDNQGGLQKVVTQQSLGNIVVPHLGENERRLVDELNASHSERDCTLSEADTLLSGIDPWLNKQLGIKTKK